MSTVELILTFCSEHPVFVTTSLALIAFTTAMIGAIVLDVIDHLNGNFHD